MAKIEEVVYKGGVEKTPRAVMVRLFYIIHLVGVLAGVFLCVGLYLFSRGYFWLGLGFILLFFLWGPPVRTNGYDFLLRNRK